MKNWKIFVAGLALWGGVHLPAVADPPQPPPPPANHGQNGNAPAGAPIDGGLGILLALGAAYGGRKVWKAWKRDEK
ncbi:MAG: hypothetical protein HQ542_11015 [Bacteroidia bacterium]|nr:hypothetical protein [Bacteroidia bacterium]